MTLGETDIWSDMFPNDLVPKIVALVWDTWQTFTPKPGGSDLEVPITQRFKHALKQAKDYRRLPVRIEREPAEDDPVTGRELGRIDIKLCPAQSALEEVYFAFECKRLNALNDDGSRETLAPEYVTEGMMRFVTGQYANKMTKGGMIGYVLDGKRADAIKLVKANIDKRSDDLKLGKGKSLATSSLQPKNEAILETEHGLTDRTFLIHHLFLTCPSVN